MKKRITYIILTVSLTVTSFFTGGFFNPKTTTIIKEIPTESNVEYYEAPDLTIEMLNDRNGKLFIEHVVGEVLDDELNGTQISNENYYIGYRGIKGIKAGDIVDTYFTYNPNSNLEDDIISRVDIVRKDK